MSIIDFGRTDLRPVLTDLHPLAVQQFKDDPALEAAFLEGYGGDPREPAAWQRNQTRAAIGTAVWGFQVGYRAFEQQAIR